MLKPTGIERATVRAAFNEQRAACRHADFLFREIERRMLERLDLIRLQPADRILDVGCGCGHSLETLAVRYPGSQMIGTDLADRALLSRAGSSGRDERFTQAARRWLSRLGVGGATQLPATIPLWIAGDAHSLPVSDGSIDMVWSNLAAHWFDDPLAAVAEWHRVIRPEGLLMFSAFGVDTLKEVRPASGEQRGEHHGEHHPPVAVWPTYQDMHDWGDALSAAGFADPVMDVEHLTLTYDDQDKFWDDAESLCMLQGMRQHGRAMQPNDPGASAGPVGTRAGLALSVEVIYGHAWCPAVKRRRDGLATVHFYDSGSRL